MTTTYWLLALAIIAEVAATLSLKASNGLTVLLPSIVVIVGYGIAFVALATVVKTLPLGITYAIWTGVGTLLITLLASALYQQQLDLPALIGMAFIIVGTLIIQLFSRTNGVH